MQSPIRNWSRAVKLIINATIRSNSNSACYKFFGSQLNCYSHSFKCKLKVQAGTPLSFCTLRPAETQVTWMPLMRRVSRVNSFAPWLSPRLADINPPVAVAPANAVGDSFCDDPAANVNSGPGGRTCTSEFSNVCNCG
jgi:hypothetical protein